MKTFLIEFRSVLDGSPRGCAFIDFDISERDLVALVVANGGDFACKSCRGVVVAGKIIDRAYELKVVPDGYLQAGVIDVSADPRAAAFQKNSLVDRDAVDDFYDGIAISGAVH